MTASGWLARRWLRARAVAVVPLAAVVFAGALGASTALAAADATATAFRTHLRQANVGDVVVNPSLSTKEIDAVIRSLPGVEHVTSSAAFTVTNDDGRPRPRSEVMLNESTEDIGVIGSHDGRFADMDRPMLVTGRMPREPNEAVLTVEAAEHAGLALGDELSLAFWSPGVDELVYWGTPDEAAARAAEIVEPIGVERVKIVGTVRLADETLPDDLYPRKFLIVSPELAKRYDCLPATPRPGTALDDALNTLLPTDCAKNYRYYSLKLAGGAATVKTALDEFLRRSSALNADLAAIADFDALGVEPPRYFLIPIETDQERERVERAVQPTVTALRVLGGAIATITVALAGFLIARELRRAQPDESQWYDLGLDAKPRALVLCCPLAAATLLGLGLAVAAGALLQIGPLGVLDELGIPGHRVLRAPTFAAASGIGAAILVLCIALAWRAVRRVRSRDAARTYQRAKSRWLRTGNGPPAMSTGVRAAALARTTPPVVAGAALLAAAMVAAIVFGASLSALLSTPRSYGWPWDHASVTGAGYGDLDLQAVTETLDRDPDVERWTVLGLFNDLSINGAPMMSVIGFDRASEVDLPLLEGSIPRRPDQVAVGATTAKRLDLSVGDVVELGGVLDGRRATVSGVVVFPTLGPLLADRVGTGTGVLLSERAFDHLGASPETGVARDFATFVGVQLRPGAPADTVERIERRSSTFDRLGGPVFTYATPVRPASIIDARSTRSVPTIVGIAFGVAIVVGIVFNAWSAARTRRHELAILRALGFRRAQVRLSLCVQSVTTMAAVMALGVPIGVLAGRALWRGFAADLGVVPEPASPLATILGTAAAALAVAFVAAWVPRSFERGSPPAVHLRTE
jgi:hypothetical protein